MHTIPSIQLTAEPIPFDGFFSVGPVEDLGDRVRVAMRAMGWDGLTQPAKAFGFVWVRGQKFIRSQPGDNLAICQKMAAIAAAESCQEIVLGEAIYSIGDKVLYRGIEVLRPVPLDTMLVKAYEAAGSLMRAVGKAAPIIDPSKPRGRAIIVRQTADAMLAIAGKNEGAQTRAAERFIDSNWPDLNKRQRDRLIKQSANRIRAVPLRSVRGINGVINRQGTRTMRGARKASIERHKFKISPNLTSPDRRSIKAAQDTSATWLTDEYGGRAIKYEDEAREIVERGLAEGLGRQQISEDLSKVFQRRMSGRSESYYRVFAASLIDKSRSRAELHSYTDAGITRYTALSVLDEGTTDFCFAAGTKITTPTGERPIEQIYPGDKIINGSGETDIVEHKSCRSVDSWLSITLSSGRRLLVTDEHPILSNGGWMMAGDIRCGDYVAKKPKLARSKRGSIRKKKKRISDKRQIITSDTPETRGFDWSISAVDGEKSVAEYLHGAGGFLQVKSIERISAGDNNNAYNLQIKKDPTYIAEGVIVHNCRWVDGKVFKVEESLSLMQAAEQDDLSTEQMKNANPWARTEKTDKGEVLWTARGKPLFKVKSSGIGTQGKGQYTTTAAGKKPSSHGIGAPPYHGLCRTTTIAEI